MCGELQGKQSTHTHIVTCRHCGTKTQNVAPLAHTFTSSTSDTTRLSWRNTLEKKLPPLNPLSPLISFKAKGTSDQNLQLVLGSQQATTTF